MTYARTVQSQGPSLFPSLLWESAQASNLQFAVPSTPSCSVDDGSTPAPVLPLMPLRE